MRPFRSRTLRAALAYGIVALSSAAASRAHAQPQLSVNGVSLPAALTVSAGSVAAVSLIGGPANTTDWLGLYAVGASDSQYLAWQYLNGSTTPPTAGLAGATLTVGLPAAPGSYEFRLFAHNTYERLATSPTVIVAASEAVLVVNGTGPPDPAATRGVAQEGATLAGSSRC